MSNLLARAADDTACSMLNDIGTAGTQLAVWTMWAPKVALVPLTVGSLGYMANNLLCPDMPGPNDNRQDQLDGCVEVEGGYGYLESYIASGGWATRNGTAQITEIVSVNSFIEQSGLYGWDVTCKQPDGSSININALLSGNEAEAQAAKFRIQLQTGTCKRTNDPADPGSPDPDLEPYPWTDPETDCNYTLKLEGFVQQYKDGPAQPVWQIESNSSAVRASGGRMGGCSLSPTIFIGGNGDGSGGPNGPPQIPVPPIVPPNGDDGVPWWLPPLVGGATAAALNLIGQQLAALSEPNYEAGSFTLTAPCDYTEEGDNVSYFFPFPKGTFQQRVIDHQEAILDTLQYHLNSKTPTCKSEKPVLEGQWVTTRWESTEKMAHSGVRLRKLFRYRTKSTRDLGQLSAYWENFGWEAGNVCVFHKGAWWGTPQIWAASQEEGQRVIRFAAAEAGLDPDQVGEWGTSSSRSPRYGMSGSMRVKVYKGFPWVASRDGASWPNSLAKSIDPLRS